MSDILIVDDERSMREFLEILLAKDGADVRSAPSIAMAMELFEQKRPDLVLTDLRMKGGSGMDLLKEIKKRDPGVEVIVITAFATDDTAVNALKMGAYDYVTKPFQVDEIRVVVQRALERQRLLRENVSMKVELTSRYDFGNLVGKSPRMQELYRLIEQVAPTKANVLVTGESGTGKELVARSLHLRSSRRDQPFVAIDCSSIPETLLESELFGHSRGSYTGATSDKKGLFELADKGTVFLDEIGEIPLSIQVKLLRVLQERSIRRIGDSRDRTVDVRLVAATNRDLDAEVAKGAFREDLYFRLNVIRIQLPALRERKDDIRDLVRYFVDKVSKTEDRAPPTVLNEAIDVLMMYKFPGNVRELENMVERAVALTGNRPIGAELFSEYMHAGYQTGEGDMWPEEFPEDGVDLDGILSAVERKWMRKALMASGGVKTRAASLLGISFRSFRYRLSKLDME